MSVQYKRCLPIYSLKRRGGVATDEHFFRVSFPTNSVHSYENFMRDTALSNVFLPHVDIVSVEIEYSEDVEEDIQNFMNYLHREFSGEVFDCLIPYVPSIFLISMTVEYATRGLVRRFCFERSVIMKCYQIIRSLPGDPTVIKWDVKQVTRILFNGLSIYFSLPNHYTNEIMDHEGELVFYLRMKYNMIFRYLIHDYPPNLTPQEYAQGYLLVIVKRFASLEHCDLYTILDYMFSVKSFTDLWAKVYPLLNHDYFNDFGLVCQDINDALIQIVSTNPDTRRTVFERSLQWAICSAMAAQLSFFFR